MRSKAARENPRNPQWKSRTGTLEEQAADAGEHRVADVLVLPGHRSRRDPAEKAVAHHEIHADAQLLDERIEPAEVVAVVSVAHDDVAAASVLRAVIQSGPVATLGHMNDSSALSLRDLWRAVRGSVVRHDHFPSKPKTGNAAVSLLNARANRECLVEAGHEHGQLDWLR